MTAWPSLCVIRSGWPASVADLPWSSKLFCPSMFTSKPPCFQFAFRLLRSAVWFSLHSAWLNSDVVLVQSWWRALNQMAHSHEFSPVSNLGNQEAQM